MKRGNIEEWNSDIYSSLQLIGVRFLALAQFIIASHSPILLGIPDAQILSFDDGVIHECEYEDTDSYQVTEMFINNREYFLGRLLDE